MAEATTRTIEVEIPSLDQRREADDLENALVGISGIWRTVADTERHVLTVEFDPDHASEKYIEHIIRESGYPIANGKGEPESSES